MKHDINYTRTRLLIVYNTFSTCTATHQEREEGKRKTEKRRNGVKSRAERVSPWKRNSP